MKKFIKPLLYSIILFILLTFVITLLNYIGLINGISLTIIKIMIPIATYILAGFTLGKAIEKKGWLNGLSLGLIITILFLIFNVITKNKITIYLILYYLSLTIFSTLGSILGINKKNPKLYKK